MILGEIANTQLTFQENIPLHTFKDPYILDLQLKDTYQEKDLEKAILRELEQFILEVGKDFSFLKRQKRMIIDGEIFYLNLLFFLNTTTSAKKTTVSKNYSGLESKNRQNL
jgi:predicted nuclease of restriction endonuclease-like (RecB) superfamily